MGHMIPPSIAVPVMAQNLTNERIILEDRVVFISNLRCIFKGTTRIYATSQISSVGMNIRPQQWLGAVLSALLGVLSLIVGAVNSVAAPFCFGGILILLATYLWHRGRPIYFLSLQTSGFSFVPIKSDNRAYIERVVMAINNAIMARG